ncbi:MAG: ilvB [Deltaproteobacteria bacterium]|nr:ilvB [Deltaproteobacteria bacterium]
MKKYSGAQIFFECLKREGVTDIFGFPGGAVLDVYHELPNYPLRHILVRHEQGAVHAADGYARSSGRPGVCLVTSGPGATNTVTGIATAYMDSIPLVVFTGQVPTMLIGNDAFQEADIVGITLPCTKHSYLVERVEDLATHTGDHHPHGIGRIPRNRPPFFRHAGHARHVQRQHGHYQL